jgi:hypothetical protein
MHIWFLIVLIMIPTVLGCSKRNISNSHGDADAASHLWVFNGNIWVPTKTPPSCPIPLNIQAPMDVSLLSSILMPGQIRGGDFKPHGGFALDTQPNGLVDVFAPMSAEVVSGAKYMESGELQFLFTFINECGISYRLDHLKTLGSKLQAIADTLPLGSEGDSKTTALYGFVVEKGDLLATEVGLSGNLFFDWGVYDLRQKNTASEDSSWAALYSPEFAHYGICWLDELAEPDKTIVAGLPTRNSDSSSDYCD